MLLRPPHRDRPAPLVALAAGVVGLVVWVLTTSGLLVVAEVLARLTGISIGVAWFADLRLHPANALGSIAFCFAAVVVCNLLCGNSALGRRPSQPSSEQERARD